MPPALVSQKANQPDSRSALFKEGEALILTTTSAAIRGQDIGTVMHVSIRLPVFR